MATTFEELSVLQAKLQEVENKLSSEIMFLKEQLQSEQNSKDELEATLSLQLSSANQEIGMYINILLYHCHGVQTSSRASVGYSMFVMVLASAWRY